jgi:pimeloyl-ACP methyl ester carboxylesterase
LLEELASAFQVYGLDLRGHGLSGRVPGAYRLQDYVPEVATFLEQVVNRPTVVIGHSMGGACGNHARGVLSSPRASTHCGGFSALVRACPPSACSYLPECIRTRS